MGSLTDKISADIRRISNSFANFISIADSFVLYSVFDPLVILPHFLVHIEHIFIQFLLHYMSRPQHILSLFAFLFLAFPHSLHLDFVESCEKVEIDVFYFILRWDVDTYIRVGGRTDPWLKIFDSLHDWLFVFDVLLGGIGEKNEKLDFFLGKIGLNLMHQFIKKLLLFPLLFDKFKRPLPSQFPSSSPHVQKYSFNRNRKVNNAQPKIK